MKATTSASSRRRHLRLIPLAIGLSFYSPPPALANLTYSGSVTNDSGDPWTQGAPLVVGNSGFASMLLNNHVDGNGVTSISCGTAWIAHGTGASASITMTGPGCSFTPSDNPGNVFVASGANSRGSFIMSGGAQRTDLSYQNHRIYLGYAAGSIGTMTMTDPGTLLRISDEFYVGYSDGSRGRLVVENQAVCEAAYFLIGHPATAVGEVVVTGSGSTLRAYSHSRNYIANSGTGSLIVQNGGLAEMRYLDLGHANGGYGEALVTGAGSRIEVYYAGTNIGRGHSSASPPGEGVLRLARGGVFYTDQHLNVGYSSYNPKGTMVFIIGNNGSDSVVPGRAEVDSGVTLNIADLLMEVDPGIGLTLGQQFVLIDYLTLHATFNRFQNAPEDGIVVTPNHHAFQINYATDLGAGDLAITATVVPVPTTDSDTDSLFDAWEIRCFGATDHPQGDPSLDPDGDGRDTANEHAAGTDPLDPNSRCQTTVVGIPTATPWDLAYSPYDTAVTYAVERATDLTGPWDPVTPTTTTIDGATILFTLPADTAGQAFYRVKIER